MARSVLNLAAYHHSYHPYHYYYYAQNSLVLAPPPKNPKPKTQNPHKYICRLSSSPSYFFTNCFFTSSHLLPYATAIGWISFAIMAKSFDELISYLLEAIALHGHQGESHPFSRAVYAISLLMLAKLAFKSKFTNRVCLHSFLSMTKFSQELIHPTSLNPLTHFTSSRLIRMATSTRTMAINFPNPILALIDHFKSACGNGLSDIPSVA